MAAWTGRPASSRDDGKPWVPWSRGNEYMGVLPGHRERVSATAWYDRRAGSMILTVEQFDESLVAYEPCWAQLRFTQTGDLLARSELISAGRLWVHTVEQSFALPGPFSLTEAMNAQIRQDVARLFPDPAGPPDGSAD